MQPSPSSLSTHPHSSISSRLGGGHPDISRINASTFAWNAFPSSLPYIAYSPVYRSRPSSVALSHLLSCFVIQPGQAAPLKKNSSFDHITLSRCSFSSLIFHSLWVFILWLILKQSLLLAQDAPIIGLEETWVRTFSVASDRNTFLISLRKKDVHITGNSKG